MYVVGLRLKDGMVQPLAWTSERLSSSRLKKTCKKFLKDPDVECEWQSCWSGLYDRKQDAKRELPRLK